MNKQWIVPYVDLVRQYAPMKETMHGALEKILSSGQYILGNEVTIFEELFANYIGVKHAIAVGSGTSALYLALKALNIGTGDEVITAPNSYLASASSIALTGAKPVFVDVANDYNINPDLIESAISGKTKAILPVHLTGRPASMGKILEISRKYNLPIIEDAAQSVGASYNGKMVGSFGEFGCFSLHPLKNLSALGDGGIITTNNPQMADWLYKARNHGHPDRNNCDFWSHNMRLDSLQAAFLNIKINYIDQVNQKRRNHAQKYHKSLRNLVRIPPEKSYERNVYHTFIIETGKRDELKQYLNNEGIDTKIHYPTPIPFLKASAYLGYKEGSFPVAEKQSTRILSLPIAEYLSLSEIDIVIEKIVRFFR